MRISLQHNQELRAHSIIPTVLLPSNTPRRPNKGMLNPTHHSIPQCLPWHQLLLRNQPPIQVLNRLLTIPMASPHSHNRPPVDEADPIAAFQKDRL
jgi:hypothetical protein